MILWLADTWYFSKFVNHMAVIYVLLAGNLQKSGTF